MGILDPPCIGGWVNNLEMNEGGLFFIDLHVIGIDVGLGVHAPGAVVFGGEDRDFGKFGLSAVVDRALVGLLGRIVTDGIDGMVVDELARADLIPDSPVDGALFVKREAAPVFFRLVNLARYNTMRHQ